MVTFEPRVSIVVPVFNSRNTIEECLDSLLQLDYPKESIEIIVVDNGSTDDTLAILQRRASKIVILQESKRGPAAARNRALRNAGGEVVAFTDSDCTVDPGWLRSLVSPLQEKNVGAAGGRILAKVPCSRIERFGELIHDHYNAIEVCNPSYVITMNWASRLSVLREMRFFDESCIRCEDVDLSYRLLMAGYGFRYVSDAVVYHRNESTLGGLAREGFLHGYHAVQTLKRHRQFLARTGWRSPALKTYRDLALQLVRCASSVDPLPSACGFAFGMGKAAGKLAGSIRFATMEL